MDANKVAVIKASSSKSPFIPATENSRRHCPEPITHIAQDIEGTYILYPLYPLDVHVRNGYSFAVRKITRHGIFKIIFLWDIH